LVPQLLDIIKELDIKSFLDLPCGDFNWVKAVAIAVNHYLGGDIVPEVTEVARSRALDIPQANFEVLNIVSDSLPAMDILMSRDCLVHLNFDLAMTAVKNIKESEVKWLLITTFPDVDANENVKTGGWRPLNMQAEPFNFPAPHQLIIEKPSMLPSEKWGRKALGLWKVADIR
jgi:hypothetical protein